MYASEYSNSQKNIVVIETLEKGAIECLNRASLAVIRSTIADLNIMSYRWT